MGNRLREVWLWSNSTFVKLGGAIGQTGTLVSDEPCECGYVLPAGSYETNYEG